MISDHCDWEDLCTTIVETGASSVWVTHGQEEALCHWALTRGIAAKPLHLLGYGEEGEGDAETPADAADGATAPPEDVPQQSAADD